jgi:transcriptional/translational regulatory protein YebC/TACO1
MFKCRFSILSIVANAAKVYGNSSNTGSVKWTRPEASYIKLNVDASFHEDLKDGSIGAVLRDVKGDFIAASSIFLQNMDSVVMAEARAMKEGLELVIRMGCNKLVAESDCIEIIEAFNESEAWWSAEAAIYSDCIDMVANIGCVSFRHVPRDANQVAHGLAQNSYENHSSCNWVSPLASF